MKTADKLMAIMRHILLDISATAVFQWIMRRRSSKRVFLQSAGAWNERADVVLSQLFQQSDFFDPRDKVQVKYEMLRAALVDEVAVSHASHQFGYSRESFYTAAELFHEKGLIGLVDSKRGPKQPRKLVSEAQQFLENEIAKNPEVSSAELAKRLAAELSIDVHRRSIERFRKERKKKRFRSPQSRRTR
jgi:transposase